MISRRWYMTSLWHSPENTVGHSYCTLSTHFVSLPTLSNLNSEVVSTENNDLIVSIENLIILFLYLFARLTAAKVGEEARSVLGTYEKSLAVRPDREVAVRGVPNGRNVTQMFCVTNRVFPVIKIAALVHNAEVLSAIIFF